VKALRRLHHHLSPSEAVSFLQTQDLDHARWVKVMYELEMDDASSYDLILNLEMMSIDTICAVIAEVVADPSYQWNSEKVAAYRNLETESSRRLEEAISRRS
jgi:cytidylate kinase